MKRMTIFDFLRILETASGDEAIELISLFQCGGIEFIDLDFEVQNHDH